MDPATQRDLAASFRDRHTSTDAGPLVLPNSWDVASTIMFAEAGFDAIGTTSAGIAAALGVPDGEQLSGEEMVDVVDRIANSVEVPVSADMEAGYGETPDAVAETVRQTIDAGAVGINLEDGSMAGGGRLDDPHRHAAKIRAARTAADDADVPLVINGRTDVFWYDIGPEAERHEAAIERANIYRDAGSDCLFVPGVTDPDTIEVLVRGIDGPLNVLGGPAAPTIDELGELGVARVSVGSGPMRATLGFLREIAAELRDEGTYRSMEGAVPYGDLHEALSEIDGW